MKLLTALTLSILILLGSFLVPLTSLTPEASALIDANPIFDPFGGKIDAIALCYQDGFYALWLDVLGPPADPTWGGDFIIGYTSLIYLWGAFTPGNYVLGLAGPGSQCTIGSGKKLKIFSGNRVIYIGTSLIPNTYW